MTEEELQNKLKQIEASLEEVKKQNQWKTAVFTALVAAIASMFSAYLGFKANEQTNQLSQKINAQEVSLRREIGVMSAELEKERNKQNEYKISLDYLGLFTDELVSNEEGVPCKAVAVLGGLRDKNFQSLVVELNQLYSCGEEQEKLLEQRFEKLSKASNRSCSRARATNTTRRKFSSPEVADQYCQGILSVPKDYIGPWADGTISFDLGKVVDGHEIWCNCIPSPNKQSQPDA